MSDTRKSETGKDETISVTDSLILNEVHSAATPEPSNSPKREAPLWLKERMEALRAMPPPTFERMKAQLKASAEARSKSDDRESS